MISQELVDGKHSGFDGLVPSLFQEPDSDLDAVSDLLMMLIKKVWKQS